MQHEQFFEDYREGDTRQTLARTITETDIVVHAGHSGDFFPHHMDAEWCRTQAFGQRIAHGTMTFAIGIGLTATRINPRAFTYGYDRLRFPRAVHIGDTIQSRITVATLTPDPKRPGFGQVVERVETTNQHGQTVMACDHILLAERREPPRANP